MTRMMKSATGTKLKAWALAGTLAAVAIASFNTSAQAMVLHNCTGQGYAVVLEGKNGGPKPSAYVNAQTRKSVHATKRFGPYRIVLPALGEGGWFSGRSATGVYSFVETQGGNVSLRNGNACPPKVEEPDYDNVRNRSHVHWCYREYRSYREWDNTFQPYDGPRRECISPYI